MDKQEALSHFYNEYFIPELAVSIEEAETKFKQDQARLTLHVANSFRKICVLIDAI
ncbi:hypothetical protein [Paenibacillus bouchesdurhonensis]|uniref:hypothetical protein n=1 Tax=Paenibacillus bouchesdurhonensis TaxID=1870990 RepID=UPI000FB2566E|nr:hypothetical protein [Paenibacillus bouchesdurhonensis]